MKNPINITLVCHSFPPVMGGGETIIYLLTKYLSRNLNFSVTVVTGERSLNNIPDEMKGNFKISCISGFEEYAVGKLGIRYVLPDVYKAIKTSSPDIIHAFNFYPGYVASIYARHNKTPFIFTFFNTPNKTDNKVQLFLGVDQEIDEALVNHLVPSLNFDCLDTLSEFYLESAIKMGVPENKVSLCYPGPDPELFNPKLRSSKIRKELGVLNSDCLIVIPARMIPRKKLEVVINSLKYLNKLPIKLVISSGGTVQPGYENYYQKILNLIIKNKLRNKIILPMKTFSLVEVGKLYSSSDICVLPSAFEGLGLGILETMQCGIPVVASNTEGIKEIITNKENGLLFTPEDPIDLANQIRSLALDKTFKSKIVMAANEVLKSRFNLGKYIAFHEKLYTEKLSSVLP